MEIDKPVRPRFYYSSHALLMMLYIAIVVAIELFVEYVWPNLSYLSIGLLAPAFYFLTYDYIYRDYKAKLESYKEYMASVNDKKLSIRKAEQLEKEEISNLKIARNIASYKLKLQAERKARQWWKFWV